MDQDNLQQQIDERCPCFAKPLKQCDCQTDEVPIVKLGESLLQEAYVPPKYFKAPTTINKPDSFA